MNVELFPDECIETVLPKDKDGYGRALFGCKRLQAHRVAYRLFVGAIPACAVVRQRCHNPACCNPRHLEVCTASENVRKRQELGRQARYESHGRAKLSREDVLRIRRIEVDVPNSRLAKKYGVSNSLIWQIKNNRIWIGVGEE